jgi:hypothetical protein
MQPSTGGAHYFITFQMMMAEATQTRLRLVAATVTNGLYSHKGVVISSQDQRFYTQQSAKSN